jgi:zinc protease
MAFDLLSQYLALDAVSPLMKALTSGDQPLATEVGIWPVTREEFSRLEVSVMTDNADSRHSIVETVLGELRDIHRHVADPEALAGIRTSVKCEHIYNTDKLHYYGFIISPMIMTTGWDFIQQYPDLLEQADWTSCRETAERWFKEPDYVATMVRPVGESGKVPYTPPSISAEEVMVYFDSTAFPEYDLTSGRELAFPPTDLISFELEDQAQYHREVFDNGLTVLIKSSPDSRVFAVNVLGKNRSANEPPDLAGITDFVNRCFEHGTLTRSAAELSRDLAKIGANVTLYDNPWIPYDDRYTTRQFSFFKFETIDEYAAQGVGLLVDMLLYPAFDSVEVENVRKGMLALAGREAGSPRNAARDLFYETLFPKEVYGKAIMGSARTIAAITVDDLRAHHARFYSPDNMIVSVSTRRSPDEVLGWLRSTLGRIRRSEPRETPEPRLEPLTTTRQAHTDLDKEQVYILLGSPLPSAGSGEETAIEVATSILSERLYLNLREKQGLAYSVGAGATFDRNFGWYYCAIGTGSENYQTALDGIILQIEKLKFDGPTQEEVHRARNQLWGRLIRAKLSRINQAYYLGVNEYLGRSPDYDSRYLAELAGTDVEAVRRAAVKYFRTDSYALVSAGKLP